MAQDIFSRQQVSTAKPITADMILIDWAGADITQASNVQIQVDQQVTRRYSLGTHGQNVAVIYPGRPVGRMTIQRLYADKSAGQNIFDLPGWNACNPTTLTIKLDGESSLTNCTAKGGTFQLTGAIVTSYGLSGDADSLQVVDNITVEFLQLLHTK
jgi:hypothetical protein